MDECSGSVVHDLRQPYCLSVFSTPVFWREIFVSVPLCISEDNSMSHYEYINNATDNIITVVNGLNSVRDIVISSLGSCS